MQKYKLLLSLGIAVLCILTISKHTKAEEILINNLYDTNGEELKTNKEYYLHMIYNNQTGFYPIYNYSGWGSGWRYGYSSWHGPNPLTKSIIKLQVSGKTEDAIVEPTDHILVEVPYYTTNENGYGYWTIYSSSGGPDLYLDNIGTSSRFKLTRFDSEFYRENRYNLGQITADGTYHPFGRVGYESHYRDSQILEITNNNNTQVEFKPV